MEILYSIFVAPFMEMEPILIYLFKRSGMAL